MGGIDKAIGAYYGAHQDKDPCMNQDSENKGKYLFGLSSPTACLPTDHEMQVVTFCRGFSNCSNAKAVVHHGQVASGGAGDKQPCTRVETDWNGGHIQGKRVQVQGKHWSQKDNESNLLSASARMKRKALELNPGIPEKFLRKWLPPKYRPLSKRKAIFNVNSRMVSTLRAMARGPGRSRSSNLSSWAEEELEETFASTPFHELQAWELYQCAIW